MNFPKAAERRVDRLSEFPILPIAYAASDLAVSLWKEGALPERAPMMHCIWP